jgi:hypothetical protein
VSEPDLRRRVRLGARVLAGVLLGAAVTSAAADPRLLVMDLPYARVWESALRALDAYPLVRASQGVIEIARTERAPLPEEAGVERVAERITVRVEAVAPKVTRVTVTVDAEALRGGQWQPLGRSPATVRTVLDRIRAAIG